VRRCGVVHGEDVFDGGVDLDIGVAGAEDVAAAFAEGFDEVPSLVSDLMIGGGEYPLLR
jgi:hypothetical protein